MSMCTSRNHRRHHSMVCSGMGSTNKMISFLPCCCWCFGVRRFLHNLFSSHWLTELRVWTYGVSSFLKYDILSPHRVQPTFDSLASVMEYINGRIPSLYRLPAFTKFTIDNLQPEEEEGDEKMFMSSHRIRQRAGPTCTLDFSVYSLHESRTIAYVCSYINRVSNTIRNKRASLWLLSPNCPIRNVIQRWDRSSPRPPHLYEHSPNTWSHRHSID